MLAISGLNYFIGEQHILHDTNLQVIDQQFVGILGPNGCGKSTLLKCVYHYYSVEPEKISMANLDVNCYSEKELAQIIAVVSQWQAINFDFTVFDMVQMGRSPHKKNGQAFNKVDDKKVREVIEQVGLSAHITDCYSRLSGGEKQRVVLARALAQEPQLLVLDEPTNHLDIKYQHEILQIVKQLNIPTLAVLHDVGLAAQYCDYLYLMKEGRIVHEGTVGEMFKPSIIYNIYDIGCEIVTSPKSKRRSIIFG